MSIMTHIRDNWCRFQGELFPEIRDAVGPLHKDHQRFVMALGIICPENFVLRISQRDGRPLCDRINLLRAFIAKAIWNIPTTRALFEHLKVDRQMRNLCGWVLPGEIPSESTFSRAFAEFAESDIAGQMHEALVKEFVGDRIVGHVSRDSTAIPAREKPAPKRSRKPSSFSSRGHGRFLSFPDDGDVAIDEARVKDAAKWDGLHSILIHGADDLDAQDVIARYHQLWEIEACFRTNKHDLKIRPIYHWTPQRIRADIAICYMSFCCLQHLRKRLNMLGHPMSPARIRKELNALQISVLRRKGTGERYAMPSPVTADAKRILTCVGLT